MGLVRSCVNLSVITQGVFAAFTGASMGDVSTLNWLVTAGIRLAGTVLKHISLMMARSLSPSIYTAAQRVLVVVMFVAAELG